MTAQLKHQSTDEAAQAEAPFLGVTQSVRDYRWVDRLGPAGQLSASAISQRHGLPDMLGRVLAARNIPVDDVPGYLDPTIKSLLPDPSTLQDMGKAASRLADAIVSQTRVAVFGDYDVDGATSSALLARFLSHHGVAHQIYIPDRLLEGYGPNATAIDGLIDSGAKLIVTVDCGTTSGEALAAASKRDVDVVVIDHHQADEQLPDVHALVNPNRQDDISGQGHLCAAGVVFLVLVATVRELRRRGAYDATSSAKKTSFAEPDLLQLLDLVALGTIADVVPLIGLNRAYVVKGLQVMHQRRNVGLRALADAAGLTQAPTPYHLGFIMGPRINAGGRIGDAALGARLLSSDDENESTKIAARLDTLNRERKDIEKEMLEQAMADAERQIEADPDRGLLIVASEAWHKGVVGLVASRLVERFQRPACVIAWDGAGDNVSGTGSLRSVAGVDIGSAVRRATADGLLAKGGGHAMAAGLTVEKKKLEAAAAFFETELAAKAGTVREAAARELDGALTPAAATRELVQLLDRAGPYGQGNPQPCFAFPAVRVRFSKVVGEAHVRCTLEATDGSRIDAIAFRAAGQPLGELLLTSAGMPIHVAGFLRRDTWGGRDRVELQIQDAARAGKS
jgi:single-stranded-DNA-specific exonuclease